MNQNLNYRSARVTELSENKYHPNTHCLFYFTHQEQCSDVEAEKRGKYNIKQRRLVVVQPGKGTVEEETSK